MIWAVLSLAIAITTLAYVIPSMRRDAYHGQRVAGGRPLGPPSEGAQHAKMNSHQPWPHPLSPRWYEEPVTNPVPLPEPTESIPAHTHMYREQPT